MPEPSAPPAGRRARRLGPALLVLGGLAVCLWYLGAEAYLLSGNLGFPLDDSWIHLQFARNLAAGRGLSYNPGELVTGSTSPLWTALLALLFALPGNVVLWVKAAGIALHLVGIHATWRLARELGLGRGLAALAAALTLSTSWLVWSALSGMEVPLFVLLSLWGTILHLRERHRPERPPLSLGLLGLAVLARPEGALLLVLAVVDRLLVFRRDESGLAWRRPALRPLLLGLGLAVCAVAGPLLFYRWAGGSFLPTTYAAKGGDFRRWLPDVQYAYVILGILFRAQPWAVLAGGAGVLALVERLGTPRDRGLLPALWLLGLPLAYSTLSPVGRGLLAGNFGRYYFPLFPVLAVLAALGLERAGEALGQRVRAGRLALPLRALLLALFLWPTAADLGRGALHYAQNVENVEDSDVKLARWLAARLPKEALLAVNDIGAMKYLLPNRVVDMVGIATPDFRNGVARGMAAGASWEQAVFAELAARRPDYVVAFPTWFPALARDPRFPPVLLLEIPRNITMGDDRLGVWATPWTRHPLRRLPGDPAPGPGAAASPPS